MGFRSVLITDDYRIKWPTWIRHKYATTILFPPMTPKGESSGALVAIHEAKADAAWSDLPIDLQRALAEDGFHTDFVVIFLHECGGITRCRITPTTISWSEPETWRRTDGITHSYCYGCSDAY